MIKNVIKWFSILVGVLLFAAAAVYYWSTSRPDVYYSSLSKTIRDNNTGWGKQVDLIPDEFAIGDSGENARKKIHTAVYNRVANVEVWARYQDLVSLGYVVYSREASVWYCNIVLRFFIQFDDNDQVADATGNIHEHGCL